MKLLEVILILVAVRSFTDGKSLRDYDEECRKQLGKDAMQFCVVACAMEKQGILVDGKFNLQAANGMIDEIADKMHPPSVNRTKNAYKMCNDDLASMSTDKCSTAAAFFYCINHHARSRFAFGANRDDLNCPCPDGPDFFHPGSPDGPDGPKHHGPPHGPPPPPPF
ncbi:Odorant binding protein 15 [Cephus cinctus]|nr:Odorant binding protein 15 [Cephus cinctus]